MPIARFQMPDGRIGRFEVPEGTAPEQAQSLIEQHLNTQTTNEADHAISSPAPKEQGFFEGLANAGGEAITNRGIGLLQTAQDLGIPVNKAFGITPEQFQQASRKAVAKATEAAKGTGVSGAIVGGLSDPLNLLPLGRLGKLALPAYGAISGFTSGDSEKSTPETRALQAGVGAVTAPVGGKIVESTAQLAAPAIRAASKITPEFIKSGLQSAQTAISPTIRNISEKTVEIPEARNILDNANRFFESGRALGANYSQPFSGLVAKKAEDTIAKPTINVPLTSEEKLFNKEISYLTKLQGKTLNLDDVDKIDNNLTAIAKKYYTSGNDGLGKKINDLKYFIREQSMSPQNIKGSSEGIELVRTGTNEWARGKRMQEYQDIIADAENTQNPAAHIRNSFNRLLRDDYFKRVTPKEELDALKYAAKTGITGELLNITSSKLLDASLGALAGFSGGGPVGAILGGIGGGLAGTAAKTVAGKLQANRATAVGRAILKSKGGMKKP